MTGSTSDPMPSSTTEARVALRSSLVSNNDPGAFTLNKAFRQSKSQADKEKTSEEGGVELVGAPMEDRVAGGDVHELMSAAAAGRLPSTPRTAKDLWALLQKRTVELASLSFSELSERHAPRSSGEEDEDDEQGLDFHSASDPEGRISPIAGGISLEGGRSDGGGSRAGWVTLKAVVRVLGIKDDAAELAHPNQSVRRRSSATSDFEVSPDKRNLRRGTTTLGSVSEDATPGMLKPSSSGISTAVPSTPSRVRTVSTEKMRRERYSRQAFLLFFFVQLYLIQLLLSVLAIALEVASYFLGRDAILNPPSRNGLSYIFVLDVFVTVLLFADVSSHALAERCWFFQSCWNVFDLVMLCLSIISLSIYTAQVMSDDALGEDFAHAVKAFRDFVRVVRLPIFLSNLVNVWRLKRDDVVLL